MRIIPLLRCSNMKESIDFYTKTLDFLLKYPEEADNEWVVDLVNGDIEVLLSTIDGTPKIPIYIRVDDVDAVFNKYLSRGLKVPNNPNSPVHNSPIDQTWGLREFYVNDPDGNTLRFATPISLSNFTT